MNRAIWAGNTPYSKFLISVGIILMCAVLFTILGTTAGYLYINMNHSISMMEMQTLLSDPTNPVSLTVLKIIQTFSAIGTFIVPPFILAYLFSYDTAEFLSLRKKPSPISLLIILLAMIAATPLINYINEMNAGMHLPGFLKSVEEWMREAEDKAAVLTKAFLQMNNTGDLFFNLFMMALIPAIGEELVFRGLIQRIFLQWSKNTHVAIWTTAIIFSAMHMQFYGFLPRMLLGGMLGYMLIWSGSLWLPIIAHFVNNAGAVIFTYLFQQGVSDIDPDKIGTESDFNAVLISLFLTVGLFFILYRKNKYESWKTGEAQNFPGNV